MCDSLKKIYFLLAFFLFRSKGKHGYIRYFAIFVIDAIYPEKKKILNIPFTIIKPYDLNIVPEFRVIYKNQNMFNI